jgi:two-component system, LytTR family, response regulator AlgR
MKLLIADDEPLARERLRQLLAEIGDCAIVGEAANGYEALLRAHELKPEVALLDIRMPGMDGLEAARHIAALEQPPAVIFTTAYSDHALEAFEAQAVDYLLKPIERSRLEKALVRARRFGASQASGQLASQLSAISAAMGDAPARTHICATLHGGIQVVPVASIRYFQADSKYVTVRFPGGQVLIEDSLKALETEFAARFLRVHRNALAALAHIQALEKSAGHWQVRLMEVPEPLEVSRRHLSEVRSRILSGR